MWLSQVYRLDKSTLRMHVLQKKVEFASLNPLHSPFNPRISVSSSYISVHKYKQHQIQKVYRGSYFFGYPCNQMLINLTFATPKN
jgi:hypothetical protein